jgi:peptidyl-prolyl cis-trans isomerase C
MARARYNSPERKKAFMENMIKFEVLAQEAKRQGLDRDPQVLLELKQAMVRKMMSDELAGAVSLESIPETEIRKYYDDHVGDYVRPEKVRASHILLPDEKTANKVAADLNKAFSGDPTHKRRIFALRARDVSTDPVTATLGGDMRFFARPEDGGTVAPELAKRAFETKDIGKMIGPFKTDKGWHLLMVTARRQRHEKKYEEAKQAIANRLFRERRSSAELDFVQKTKAKSEIEIRDELLDKVPDPPAPDAGTGGPNHGGVHSP